MESYKLAKAGNAMEQRNVAVSYDAGYLVAACPEKAHFWYQKAAGNGDQIARKWLARYDKFEEIHDGPEFAVAHRDAPEKTSASSSPAAKKTNTAVAQQSNKFSAERMLDDLNKQPDTTSDMGKLVEVGQLIGDLMKARPAPASAH